MDDSQSPGDIAHASCLNDGRLLSTPLSNYLYRFVSVRLSVFQMWHFFLCVVEIPRRGKIALFLQPTESQAFFGKQTNITSPVVDACSLKQQ